jgi:FtsZ-binding cell division protein ZapB
MTISQFVEEKSKLIGKVETYDILIEKLELAILTSMDNGHLTQLEVDDSMMRVRSNYRSITDMNKAMDGLIKTRQYYKNQCNGRISVLRGGNL